MPSYTLQNNLRTQRHTAYESLAVIFEHLDQLGVDITSVTIATAGGTAGRMTIATTQAIPAEQIAHLGLQ